jgi:hypothetical protein
MRGKSSKSQTVFPGALGAPGNLRLSDMNFSCIVSCKLKPGDIGLSASEALAIR